MIDEIALPRIDCPLCGERLSRYARGLTYHARMHKIEPERLFCVIFDVEPRTCGCGCGENTRWLGWKRLAYAGHILGHESRTTSGRSSRSRALRQAYTDGTCTHWTKSHADAPSRQREAGHKTSEKLRDGFKTGEYVHWLRVEGVKDSDAYKRWRASIERSRPRGQDHWKSMSDEQVLERIKSSIGDRFHIDDVTLSGALCTRQNNVLTRVRLTCSRCQTQVEKNIYGIIRGEAMCQSCDRNYVSRAENEIGEYVSSLGFDVKRNDRSIIDGHELDVFLPQKRLAIEHNGLYWHSTFVNPRKTYHDMKRRRCINNGVTLFNVFEDEWRDKNQIVRSMIAHRLGVTQRTIYARECHVTKRDKCDVGRFFDVNHIDGNVRSTDVICLEHDDEIIAAASLRRPFHKRWKGHIELARFCTRLNVHVPGALSRLTHEAIKVAKDRGCVGLLTYIDTRFGADGSCYDKAGWSNAEESGIRWWWTDKVNRHDRFKFRATSGMTEMQVAEQAGVAKLFGTVQLRMQIIF